MECRVRQVTASEADKQWVKEFTAAARDGAGVRGEGSSMWGLFGRLLNIYIYILFCFWVLVAACGLLLAACGI